MAVKRTACDVDSPRATEPTSQLSHVIHAKFSGPFRDIPYMPKAVGTGNNHPKLSAQPNK